MFPKPSLKLPRRIQAPCQGRNQEGGMETHTFPHASLTPEEVGGYIIINIYIYIHFIRPSLHILELLVASFVAPDEQ